MAKAIAVTERKLRIMVSSTVYGIEPLLEQVFGILESFEYEVWMSFMGTIPNFSRNHAFDDCLEAVKQCDVFFSIITPQYGSGVLDGNLGITHQELELAIQRRVPRWVMAHERVKLARSFFKKLGYHTTNQRDELLSWLGFDDADERKKMLKREANIIDDFRVIDMYDLASRQGIANVDQRNGNWVQEFKRDDDVKRYVNAQFHDLVRIHQIIRQVNSVTQRGPRKASATARTASVKRASANTRNSR
jgi:hypothetical protein